jgi:hypothetical protein
MRFGFRPANILPAALILGLSVLAFGCSQRESVFADGATEAEGIAEARRLYDEAASYLNRIDEGPYSYAYIQFYWLNALGNLERILRVYDTTPTAAALRDGTLRAGPFDLEYFRDRVLPRLEEKRTYAVDDASCAVFLYNRDPMRFDETRRRAMEAIVEVLARRARWGEAFDFPVLDSDLPRRNDAIFRVAARQGSDDIVEQMLLAAEEDPARLIALNAMLGEAHALRGVPREEIAAFLDEHPEDAVKLGVLNGMVLREIEIQRAAALRRTIDPETGINTPHFSVLRPEVRDDVAAVARTFFPAGNSQSDQLLAFYGAALGARPQPAAAAELHAAYVEHLGVLERFDEVQTHIVSLAGERRTAAEFKAIEAFAFAGRKDLAEAQQATLVAREPGQADRIALALFRGEVNSPWVQFDTRPATLSSLSIEDPLILAEAIMTWSLAPNQRPRGAAPWDAVVLRYLPGWQNLPLPESEEVGNASRDVAPFR